MKEPYEIDAACTKCGYRFELASSVQGDGPPEDGSLSMCFRCGNVDMFIATFGKITTRALTPEESAEVERMPHIREAREKYVTRHNDLAWEQMMEHGS